MNATWPLMMNNIRRLTYLSGEDFYLMTYITLIILDSLLGKSETKRFKDHRKMAVIIQLLSDPRLVDLLNRYQDKQLASYIDREFLFDSFSKSELHKREINKVLQVLERKGFIKLYSSSIAEAYDISFIKTSVPDQFLKNEIFEEEYASIAILQSNIKRIAVLTLDTFIEKVYREKGVNVWAV